MKSKPVVLHTGLGLLMLSLLFPAHGLGQHLSDERSAVFEPEFDESTQRTLDVFRHERLEAFSAEEINRIERVNSGDYSLEDQLISLDLFRSLGGYDRGLFNRGQTQAEHILSNSAPANRVITNAALLSALEFFAHSPLRRSDVEAGVARLRAIIEVGAASPDVQSEIHFWRAEGFRALGEFAQAEEEYNLSLAKSSEPRMTALVEFRMAELFEREQRYAAADSAFAMASHNASSPLMLAAVIRRAAVQRSEKAYRGVLATLDSAEALYHATEHSIRTSARDFEYSSPLVNSMMLGTTEHDRILGSSPENIPSQEAAQQLISPFYLSEIALLRGSALSELGEYARATEVLTKGEEPLDKTSDSLAGNPTLQEQARFYSDALRFERAWSLFQQSKNKEAAAAFLELSVTDSARRQRLLCESTEALRDQGLYYDPFLNDSSSLSRPVNIDQSVLTKLSIDTGFFLYNDFPERARFYAGIALARAGMLNEASEELLKPTLDKSMLYSDRAQYQLALIRFAQHSYEAQKLLEPIAYEQSVRGAYASFLLGELAYRRNFYERAEGYLLNSFANLPIQDTATRASAHLERGLSLIPLGNWADASDELHTYFALTTRREPGKTDEALFWLGKSYFRNAQYDSARTTFERLLVEFPQSARTIDAQYAYAWSLFAANDFARAEPAFERVIALDSISRYSYDVLARAGDSYYAMGGYPAASRVYNKAVDRPAFNEFRTTRALMMLGLTRMKLDSSRSAMNEFGFITTKYPKSDIVDEAYFNQALAAYAINLAGSAEQSIDKIVRQYPHSPLASRALYVAGEERVRRGDAHGSTPYYSQVLHDYPLSREAGPALFALQDALVSLKRMPEALGVADTFVTRNPGHPLAPGILLRSGELRLKLGEATPALASFEQFIKNYPTNADRPRAELLAARATLASKDTASSLAQLESIISKYDTLDVAAEAHLDRARIERIRKLNDSAARDFESAYAIEHFSSDAAPEAMFAYGQMLAEDKLTDSAVAVFTSLYSRYPIESSIGARAAIRAGELLWSKDRTDEAREIFQNVVATHSKDMWSGAAMVRIGEAYLGASDWKLALDNFSAAKRDYALSADATARLLFGMARANAKLGKKNEARAELRSLLDMHGVPEELRARAESLMLQVQPSVPKKKSKGKSQE